MKAVSRLLRPLRRLARDGVPVAPPGRAARPRGARADVECATGGAARHVPVRDRAFGSDKAIAPDLGTTKNPAGPSERLSEWAVSRTEHDRRHPQARGTDSGS